MQKNIMAIFLAGLIASSLQALTVNVVLDTGTVNNTTALTGFGTNGDMMTGMNVTAYFSAGGPQTVLWATTVAGAGAATGTGWSLSMSGDTFGGTWTLANTGSVLLTRLVIDAGPGDSVFDTYFGDLEGTAGSARGLDFAVNSITAVDSGDTITATYRDAVSVGAAAAVGDLFRRLDISFNDGLSAGSTMGYVSDTDNLKFAGDLTPVPDAGSTMALFGLGVMGLGLYRRRMV